MENRSETDKRALDTQSKSRIESKRVVDETWKHADEAYKEAKKQADIVYNEAKKIAVDKQAKKLVGEAHKEALKQAKKLHDAIIAEAMVVFRSSYDQATTDYDETMVKSQQSIKNADKAYKESKKQADIVYNEAKKTAVDKQAKNQAEEAHKKALEQAKQVQDGAARKLR